VRKRISLEEGEGRKRGSGCPSRARPYYTKRSKRGGTERGTGKKPADFGHFTRTTNPKKPMNGRGKKRLALCNRFGRRSGENRQLSKKKGF